MPQAFLEKGGVSLEDFKGEAGFSGDHDKTIKVVEAGSYEVGALSSSTWNKRTKANEVDLEKVQVETLPKARLKVMEIHLVPILGRHRNATASECPWRVGQAS